ncbi:MAG TPA: tRNA dihydrouridine synthase DusB [Vicinamibacteria bacterium]|nr:tRNA dihydrouridine synthase DusB [Vicinamibacteria bacterium]
MDLIYRSELNREVPPAAPGEFPPLAIGPIPVSPPIVLAPMAGVTNPPFRTLCRRFGAGLYVSEMITARALVMGNRKTLLLAGFGDEESVRSLQLYGVDPHYVGEAVRFLVGEGRVDHIDMNFGCPVRKVTSKGGGAAIPLKPRLLRGIVAAAVGAAGPVPVTLKFRKGIDDRYLTYLDAGRIGEDEGCAAVALHARTAAQLYDGEADWDAIARLKAAVTRIPVLGNGDVWEAEDALRMMRLTGCDGVVVGRGCLGRPWLFRDLAAVFAGRAPDNPPDFGGVVDVMLEHARLLVAWLGDERAAMRAFRKHSSWYTKGFRGGAPLRQALMQVTQYAEFEAILAGIERSLPFPPDAMRVPRGKTAGTQKVALPEGYLEHLDDAVPPGAEAEAADSGG